MTLQSQEYENAVSCGKNTDTAGSPNILRNTIFIDGGQLWYQKGYDDGCVEPNPDNNLEGTIYYLNLTTPFDTSSDFMTILKNMSVAGGAASNIAPTYVDGTMFANDNEFYLYGGMLPNTDSTEPPPANQVLSYAAYQYGAFKSSWTPGWNQEYLSKNVTRYITNGAAASVPSENLGFYFSGMRAPDWGDFTVNQLQSNVTAHTLITLDMSTIQDGKWTNDTLPSYIPGRANAELVWVPVSDSGVLVAIGGVIDPIQFFRTSKSNSSRTEESKKISPTFMETVSVFDVKSQKWYLQKTTGDIPPQLTEFCSVLASAEDGSSHNIYIYGGYDGLDYNSNPSDDVYILSLPSFQWVKAYKGTNTHSRSGHKCIKVYPDQMLAVGGQHVDSTRCLEGGIIVNFNLNTLKFDDEYDPKTWGEYEVPDAVIAQIGGDSKGSATTTAPNSWTNSSLAAIFAKKYTKNIETYWPYNSSSTDTSPEAHKAGGGFPAWAGGLIGAIVGLLVIAVLLGLWFYRRRHRKFEAEKAKVTEEESDRQSPEWMYGSGPASPGPGPVSTSTDRETYQTSATLPSTQTQPSMTQSPTVADTIVSPVTPGTVESGGGALYELHDSSPAELPTPYNIAYLSQDKDYKDDSASDVKVDMRRGSLSPVSPQTPSDTATQFSFPTGRNRRISTLSVAPTWSIDNVMSGRMTHFNADDDMNIRRARHGSDATLGSSATLGGGDSEKGWVSGTETIRE
ncbi:Galactose oxidase/kelch beta-propeller [Penicillium bovifimosum]|uniref:Galactose oxidase/kelch beta-propeller n=1 Tax=Penicillium bovifimosum TaxID=126998 RepID=A0A9W9L9M8_9EURO|nr:Galactose oxidase/kelch beta-propeller [Penicillium bovifimosum]KAJ5144048.1 Galactose oxidase/kelch beta-propeller [Penicillium bovifimosum]